MGKPLGFKMKIAHWAMGKRKASTLTYEQWCKQNDARELRLANAIIAKEVNKYAGH